MVVFYKDDQTKPKQLRIYNQHISTDSNNITTAIYLKWLVRKSLA